LNELAQYLFDNMIIDFEGEVTTETVRAFLRKDEGPIARALLQKIIEDKGIDDLVIALADVLKANVANGIDSSLIREHLVTYSES
jgi:predicted GTPase